MTQVFETPKAWVDFRKALDDKRIGFVPTMGALHEGHLSLIRRSRAENDVTVVSIFVNPTQFNDASDFKNYPRDLKNDVALLRREHVDFVLLPEYGDLYGDGYRFQIHESQFSTSLCGAYRLGHFTGVLTIVMKLLNLTGATRAYFGEKDFQQLQLIKDMAQAFFLPVEIVGCPTIREKDGLAMSSRNLRLDPVARGKAALFPKLLSSQKASIEIRADLEKAGFKVDYIEEHFGRRFGAVHLGAVRLIDNVEI